MLFSEFSSDGTQETTESTMTHRTGVKQKIVLINAPWSCLLILTGKGWRPDGKTRNQGANKWQSKQYRDKNRMNTIYFRLLRLGGRGFPNNVAFSSPLSISVASPTFGVGTLWCSCNVPSCQSTLANHPSAILARSRPFSGARPLRKNTPSGMRA